MTYTLLYILFSLIGMHQGHAHHYYKHMIRHWLSYFFYYPLTNHFHALTLTHTYSSHSREHIHVIISFVTSPSTHNSHFQVFN